MNTVALIPARQGSKGVHHKNIKIINGKPLISWSIEHALNAKCIDDVYVSTDSEKIREIAISYGARAPFLRPADISNDTASTESVVEHFLEWALNNGLHIDYIILIQATSPMRYYNQIDLAMKQFIKERSDSLVTVSRSHSFTWVKDPFPVASYDILDRPRRQDVLKSGQTFIENGSFYISKTEIYKNYKSRLGGKISLFEMTPEESYEIDNELDFCILDLILKRYENDY